jgi:hypothetical protein
MRRTRTASLRCGGPVLCALHRKTAILGISFPWKRLGPPRKLRGGPKGPSAPLTEALAYFLTFLAVLRTVFLAAFATFFAFFTFLAMVFSPSVE